MADTGIISIATVVGERGGTEEGRPASRKLAGLFSFRLILILIPPFHCFSFAALTTKSSN